MALLFTSNTNLRLPEIFSNNASDSNSSTVPSVFDLSSESESESKDKSEDKLALEDKEKFYNSIKRGPVLAIITRDKKLSLKGRPKATIYIEDIAENIFPIPEIIFNPILVLSPYIFLLGILFRISVFKSLLKDGPIIDYPKKLYYLRILDRLIREANSLRIVLEKGLIRIKRGSKITGFTEVAKLYYLRYGVVKYASINTFIRYYSIGIYVDT
ncbi:hypothetical protein N7537_011471 [Penicillium hordei]|uniref:Uncharacterized protein n=1 Tax=Penicillium hordei TaxID=40994 RepID=A0AAD6GSS8_9EURO|nr:uncharacterized protein N7537_011471 [Penicillium hordei]KAJ5588793.1 hypothetical protein N7537_011471 [Penicillium hordei]